MMLHQLNAGRGEIADMLFLIGAGRTAAHVNVVMFTGKGSS
jgi:hypothetical protein